MTEDFKTLLDDWYKKKQQLDWLKQFIVSRNLEPDLDEFLNEKIMSYGLQNGGENEI